LLNISKEDGFFTEGTVATEKPQFKLRVNLGDGGTAEALVSQQANV
jgi:hypothetical protein